MRREVLTELNPKFPTLIFAASKGRDLNKDSFAAEAVDRVLTIKDGCRPQSGHGSSWQAVVQRSISSGALRGVFAQTPLDRSFRNVARTWRFQFAVFKSK